MPPPRRVALMFQLDQPDLQTREIVRGIHRWATEHPGRWLDELPRPVGIFACRDVLALCLADLCEAKGLRVPTDVGLIGAGNDPALCLGAPAPLTSIDFGWETVGYEAAALLDRLMEGRCVPRAACRVAEGEADEGRDVPRAACRVEDKQQAPGTESEIPSSPLTPNTENRTPSSARRRNILISPTLVPRASTGRDELYADTHVADALACIERRCHLPLRVADVARAVGLRERQLLRRFQQVRGHSIVQEITRARIRRAQDVLQFTDLPVGAVARAVGFRTGRHLTRLFLEHHGVSPTVWRRGRPAPPPCDPLDIKRAKWYLEATNLPVPLIAQVCGFRSQAELSSAFHRHEGETPGACRGRVRKARPAAERFAPPAEVRFIGPGGDEEPEA